MKLSELIPLIEKCMKEHGDLPVVAEQHECLFPAEQLIVERANLDDAIEDGAVVARII